VYALLAPLPLRGGLLHRRRMKEANVSFDAGNAGRAAAAARAARARRGVYIGSAVDKLRRIIDEHLRRRGNKILAALPSELLQRLLDFVLLDLGDVHPTCLAALLGAQPTVDGVTFVTRLMELVVLDYFATAVPIALEADVAMLNTIRCAFGHGIGHGGSYGGEVRFATSRWREHNVACPSTHADTIDMPGAPQATAARGWKLGGTHDAHARRRGKIGGKVRYGTTSFVHWHRKCVPSQSAEPHSTVATSQAFHVKGKNGTEKDKKAYHKHQSDGGKVRAGATSVVHPHRKRVLPQAADRTTHHTLPALGAGHRRQGLEAGRHPRRARAPAQQGARWRDLCCALASHIANACCHKLLTAQRTTHCLPWAQATAARGWKLGGTHDAHARRRGKVRAGATSVVHPHRNCVLSQSAVAQLPTPHAPHFRHRRHATRRRATRTTRATPRARTKTACTC
jgi:hypothetical protein